MTKAASLERRPAATPQHPCAETAHRQGLPLDIDVAAFYSAIPTNIKLFGAELRYAVLPGVATGRGDTRLLR
jgi:hypothetical protein